MSGKNITIALGVVLVMMAAMVTGTAAYSSFSADRQATLDVATDANGVIGLNPGTSSYVSYEADGTLQIDVTAAGASGVNADSVMQIGDPANPSSTYAFSMANNYDQTRDITLSYALTGTDADTATEQLNFTVYDNTGTQVASIGEGGSATLTASSGSTYYVVLETDFVGVTDSADYTGTLTIEST